MNFVVQWCKFQRQNFFESGVLSHDKKVLGMNISYLTRKHTKKLIEIFISAYLLKCHNWKFLTRRRLKE